MRIKMLLLTVLIALLASLAPTAATAAADKPMSQARAGRYYLRNICTWSAAEARFETRVWHGKSTITFAELKRRWPKIKYATERFRLANHRLARVLFNPPAPWPDNVTRPVRVIATLSAREAVWLGKMELSPRRWSAIWRNHARPLLERTGSKSETVRAKLNLPPPGEGC